MTHDEVTCAQLHTEEHCPYCLRHCKRPEHRSLCLVYECPACLATDTVPEVIDKRAALP